MKKNILSVAVASGVAGLALNAQAAMYLNPEGTGEVLLFPYYNAQNGNETSMHIVNTTGLAKAIKIRFMEYVNSQEVLDFNVYMSPRDHFSFTIFADPNGDGAAIVTRDNTCTVPELGTGSGTYAGTKTENADGSITRIQPFLPYQYAGANPDAFDSITRTLVGHVEVIEMGTVEDEADDSDDDTVEFEPASYMTHGADGVPADCAALVAAWSTGGDWVGDNDAEINPPTGGLYGVANMLNNEDAAAYGMEAAAIADFWEGDTNGHTEPGDLFPSLAEGDTSSLVANGGDFFTLSFDAADRVNGGVDAVSSLFMAETIANDVMANPDLAGETDWVVTFPTRRYYVNQGVRQPFTDAYVGAADPDDEDLAFGPTSSCEVVGVTQIDREESTTVPGVEGPIFSPAPPDAPAGDPNVLCYETNTIAINGVSALNASLSTDDVLDAAISLPWGQDQAEGWQTIDFVTDRDEDGNVDTGNTHWMEADAAVLGRDGDDAAGLRMNGLPVIGFAAFEYTNGSKNFGFVSDHKTSIGGSAVTSA